MSHELDASFPPAWRNYTQKHVEEVALKVLRRDGLLPNPDEEIPIIVPSKHDRERATNER